MSSFREPEVVPTQHLEVVAMSPKQNIIINERPKAIVVLTMSKCGLVGVGGELFEP